MVKEEIQDYLDQITEGPINVSEIVNSDAYIKYMHCDGHMEDYELLSQIPGLYVTGTISYISILPDNLIAINIQLDTAVNKLLDVYMDDKSDVTINYKVYHIEQDPEKQSFIRMLEIPKRVRCDIKYMKIDNLKSNLLPFIKSLEIIDCQALRVRVLKAVRCLCTEGCRREGSRAETARRS